MEMFDFGTLSVEALDLNIHIGEASYWSPHFADLDAQQPADGGCYAQYG